MAGSFGREYSKAFLKFGMAFVGGHEHVESIQRVKPDDRILLKKGKSELVAVGRVVARDGKYAGKDDKKWLRDFDGWNLAGYCFVEWHKLDKATAVPGLGRRTIEPATSHSLRQLAEEVLAQNPVHPSDPEPPDVDELKDDEILRFLVAEGLRPAAAEEVGAALRRIRTLAEFYYRHCSWNDIREHELRAFLVMPLLLGLGWSEQQIKLEYPAKTGGKIDVACFAVPYSKENKAPPVGPINDTCRLIVETTHFKQDSITSQSRRRYTQRASRHVKSLWSRTATATRATAVAGPPGNLQRSQTPISTCCSRKGNIHWIRRTFREVSNFFGISCPT